MEIQALWFREMVTDMLQDLRDGLRVLRREPGYVSIAVVVAALAIGATTTLFSVTNHVLLRPLPWPESERLIRLEETRGNRPGRRAQTITNGTYLAWRDRPATIEALGGWRRRGVTMRDQGNAERLEIVAATPSLFNVLRVGPHIGRVFVEEDADRGQAGVMVLGFGLWQQRFGGRPDALGRPVQLGERSYTIVGVMPRGFGFPDGRTQVWVPLYVPPAESGGMRLNMLVSALARLQPGVTAAQAAAEATARAQATADRGDGLTRFGSDGEVAVAAAPALEFVTADVRPAIVVLNVAGALLFLTAVASLVNMQLTRVVKRRSELALRAALGAGTARLTRQWLVESGIVGLIGGLAGVTLSILLHRLLPVVLPFDFPRVDEITLDARVLSFAVLATVAVGAGCGLVPALQARKLTLSESLALNSRGPVGGGARTALGRARGALIVGQIAVACVLSVSGLLLARSFVELLEADRGYNHQNVLTAQIPLPPGANWERYAPMLEALQARVQALPGVTHVAFGNALPFVATGEIKLLTMPDPYNPTATIQAQAVQRVVSPDYFETLRLRITAGRHLNHRDTATAPRVVVVNRSFADQFLGERPIGSYIPVVNGLPDWEVVGVVDDMKQGGILDAPSTRFGGVAEPPQPAILQSYRQIDSRESRFVLLVRTVGDPLELAPTLRSLLRDEDPSLVLDSIMTMEDRVLTSLAKPRTYAVLLGGFAAFAVVIAGVGLLGVLSYTTAQRTREIAIRAALGARPGAIVGLVLRHGAAMTASGLGIGLLTTFIAVRLLVANLYGISAYDPLSFFAATVMVAVVSLAACAAPAWVALRVDPLVALRTD